MGKQPEVVTDDSYVGKEAAGKRRKHIFSFHALILAPGRLDAELSDTVKSSWRVAGESTLTYRNNCERKPWRQRWNAAAGFDLFLCFQSLL
jgi:hypothetical protein